MFNETLNIVIEITPDVDGRRLLIVRTPGGRMTNAIIGRDARAIVPVSLSVAPQVHSIIVKESA